MKKCFRVVSVFVLFTFLFNGIVLDSSKSFGMGELSTLSPVLKFSGLAGIEPKEMVRVEFSLESALLDFADGDKEIDVDDLVAYVNDVYKHSSVFDDTHIFFAEREVLDNGKIKVMARVMKQGANSETILRTYYAVFSTKKQKGGFSIDSYTEKEWKENEKIIRHGKDLPKRNVQQPKDAKAMARYKKDNGNIDEFIEERIYDGDFAKIEEKTAEDLWDPSLTSSKKKPTIHFPLKYMQHINDKLNGFLGNFGTDVETALCNKSLVFIRVPEGVGYPIIYEKDSVFGNTVPIPVKSHTSERAVYVFLDNYTFDALKDPDVRWDLIMGADILPRLIYEIGVIYGLPYKVIDRKQTMNDLLEAYRLHNSGVDMEEIKEEYSNLQLKQKVNLNETLWTRDYFMAEQVGYVQADDNVEALAKAIAEEFYKESDAKKREMILKEVERRLAIYSLKAIIWRLMAQNQLTSSEQLDNVTTQEEADWALWTDIPSDMDMFLRKKIVEWINIQAEIKGSALRDEINTARIVSTRAVSGPSYLRVSQVQEKTIIDSVVKPTMKELFGYWDPDDFVETEDFSDKINSYLKEAEKADKGPYWYTVEEDLRRLIEEGRVVKITKDGQVVNVKTGEAEKVEEDIVEGIKKTLEILKEWNNHSGDSAWESDTVRRWAGKISKSILTEKSRNKWESVIATKLQNAIQEWTNGAEDMEVFVVLDSAYVSPRTKEVAHVGRKGNRIWLPGLLFKEVQRIVKEDDTREARSRMPLLFVDEQQHVGKTDASHGKIKTLDDIGKVVEHILKPGYDEFPFREARSAWEKSMEGKMPWEPLLKGGTVGQSPKFVEFFEDLKEFATNDMKRTALVYGADGHGKTKTVDAVQEMMNISGLNVMRIDCTIFKDLTADKIYELLFETRYENNLKKELLVLDNFNRLKKGADSTKMLLSLLENVRKGETQLYLGREKPIDIVGLKMLCISGNSSNRGDIYDPKDVLTGLEEEGILEEFQEKINLPNLIDREDDILRIAEYFNFEASKRRKIDYAPMDEFLGGEIKKLVEQSYAITIWDIKDLIETIVANRTKMERYSDYLITYADVHIMDESTQTALPELAELWEFKKTDEIKTYYGRQKELLPYFKEFVEKDKMGNPIGFYKGRRGEQPGLPRGGFRGLPSLPKHPGLFKNSTQPADKKDQQKKKLKTLKEYANEVGKLIAPPVSPYYTLFTACDLATDEEYDEDIKNYVSRFNLERISTDKLEDIVEKVLEVVRREHLNGENIIVQLPEEFALNRYNINELIDEAPGIRFMVIDTKGMKNDRHGYPKNDPRGKKIRKQYRDVVYNMMRLARNIDENSSPMVSVLLNYFVDYCFESNMNSSHRATLIGTYLENLSCNKISNILDVVLSYKYMTKHTLPEKALITKPLVSV